MANSTRVRQPNPNQELLTARQAAQTFGIPERSLYDLVLRGVLPAVKIPTTRRIWYRRADIQSLINSSTTTSAA